MQPSCSKRVLKVDDEWLFAKGRAATSKSMSAFPCRHLVASHIPRTLQVALRHVGPDPVWIQFGREKGTKGFALGRPHRAPSDMRSPAMEHFFTRCIATFEMFEASKGRI